jgi:hypothetical protein
LIGGGTRRTREVDKHLTAYNNMQFATEIRAQGVTIPKIRIFAEGEAKVDAQQIINNITNTIHQMARNSMARGFCIIVVGNKKHDILILTATMMTYYKANH